MSFDTVFSLALFAGALFLMMRFGCGAHMSHAHGHGPSGSENEASNLGRRSADTAPPTQMTSTPAAAASVSNIGANSGSTETSRNARRHGCC